MENVLAVRTTTLEGFLTAEVGVGTTTYFFPDCADVEFLGRVGFHVLVRAQGHWVQ